MVRGSRHISNFGKPYRWLAERRPLDERKQIVDDLSDGTFWGHIKSSTVGFLIGAPNQEQYEQYQRVEDAVKTTANIDDQTWESMTRDQREEYIDSYMEAEGKKRAILKVTTFDQNEEAALGHIKPGTKMDQVDMSKRVTQYVRQGIHGRKVYDMEKGEVVNTHKNKNFKEGLSNKGTFEIIKRASPKNPYAEKNPELANSYVAKVTLEDGTEKHYLVSRSEGYHTNPETRDKALMNSVTSEIYNKFPTQNLKTEYSKGNVSLSGMRVGDAISVNDLKRNGVSLTDDQKRAVAENNGLPYNEQTGEIMVSEEILSLIVLALNQK